MANGTKIAVTWLELILALLLIAGGLGSWRSSKPLAEMLFEPAEPRVEDFERRHYVSKLERGLTAAEDEWRETLTLAHRQRLEIEQQTAQIDALERTFAAIQANGPANIPPEPLAAYQKVRDQRVVTEVLAGRLEDRLRAIEERLARAEEVAAAARQAAAAELEKARTEHGRNHRIQTALACATGVMVFFLAAFAALSGRPLQKAQIRRNPVFAVATAVLLILILYEALGAFALALGSMIALVALRVLFLTSPGEV